jgi:hypothetical protein
MAAIGITAAGAQRAAARQMRQKSRRERRRKSSFCQSPLVLQNCNTAMSEFLLKLKKWQRQTAVCINDLTHTFSNLMLYIRECRIYPAMPHLLH